VFRLDRTRSARSGCAVVKPQTVAGPTIGARIRTAHGRASKSPISNLQTKPPTYPLRDIRCRHRRTSANSCQQPLRSHRRSALPRPLARSGLAEPLWSCAEYQRTLGLLPCLRHPLIDTFRNSPIDEQVKILCASHTMLARRDPGLSYASSIEGNSATTTPSSGPSPSSSSNGRYIVWSLTSNPMKVEGISFQYVSSSFRSLTP
jgi:hypothetical protein